MDCLAATASLARLLPHLGNVARRSQQPFVSWLASTLPFARNTTPCAGISSNPDRRHSTSSRRFGPLERRAPGASDRRIGRSPYPPRYRQSISPAFLASRSAKARAALWKEERGKDAFPSVCTG